MKKIKKMKDEFREKAGRSIKVTEDSRDDSVQLISVAAHSPRKLAYYRVNVHLTVEQMPPSTKQRQVKEIIKCGKDPIYFFNKYVKIQHATRGTLPFNTYGFQEYRREKETYET